MKNSARVITIEAAEIAMIAPKKDGPNARGGSAVPLPDSAQSLLIVKSIMVNMMPMTKTESMRKKTGLTVEAAAASIWKKTRE